MSRVKVYNSKSGVIVNEFTVDNRQEGIKIGREIMYSAGIRNVKEYFTSLVGYDQNGRDSIHVSILEN